VARWTYRQPTAGHLIALLPVVAYISVLFVFPLARIFAFSFFNPTFTLDHYVRFFTVSLYSEVLWITFKIAGLVTLAALCLGYPVAYLLNSVSSATRSILLIFVLMPFWTSVLVRTYAWMVLLQRQGVVNLLLLGLGVTSAPLPLIHNTLGVLVGMTHVLLPFMILPILSVMRGIDPDLVRAAQSLGATPTQAFVRVFFPLTIPGIAAGCLLVSITAIGFFVTPALLGGPRDTMVSQLIAIQVGQLLNWGFGAAIALVLLLVTITLFLLFSRFLRVDVLLGEGAAT
jgi:ABC-type spermidine/putrescine transport system permease subunit I